MGYYINPPGYSKEEFLMKNGIFIQQSELPTDFTDFPNDCLPVALLDNGPFTAAGICYDPREYQVFKNVKLGRPIQWFLVKKELLEPYLK